MKALKKLMIAGVVLLLAGVAVFLAGLAMNGWKFGPEYSRMTFVSEGQETDAIGLNVVAGKLNCSFYDGDRVEISYPTSDDFGYRVSEEDGKVTLSPVRNSYWFWLNWTHIPDVNVKIPQTLVPDLNITLSAGSVYLDDGAFGTVTMNVSAGTLHTGNLTCDTLTCKLSAGSANLGTLTAQSASVHLSAGSFNAGRTDCPDLSIDLSAGSAAMTVAGSEDEYNISVDCSAGSCNLSSRTSAQAFKRLDIDLSAGSVTVNFTN